MLTKTLRCEEDKNDTAEATLENELQRVSVVVLNYNGKHFLKNCLESLHGLDYPSASVEVILVDNASTDGSVEFVRSNFPSVRVVRNSRNLGVSSGYNSGARTAKFDYVLFLNNDTEVHPQLLKRLVTKIGGQVACVGCTVLDFYTKDVQVGKTWYHILGFAGLDYNNISKVESRNRTDSDELSWCSGCAFFVSRKVFLALGGFDENLGPIYGEDLDLSFRIRLSGYSIIYAPDAIVYHKGQAGKQNPTSTYLNEKNKIRMIQKLYTLRSLLLTLPAILGLRVLMVLYYLLKKDWENALAITHAMEAIIPTRKVFLERKKWSNTRDMTIFKSSSPPTYELLRCYGRGSSVEASS